jgi:HEAT repeat protein/4-amino-4-deoxy-L-arabinose transferase-like glycosyltransferase
MGMIFLSTALLLFGTFEAGESLQRLIIWIWPILLFVFAILLLEREERLFSFDINWKKGELILLLLVVLIALFMRTYKLSSIPPAVNVDERWLLKSVSRLVTQGLVFLPFDTIRMTTSGLEAYMVAPFLWIIEDNILATRLAHALAGTACVAFMFLFVRKMFNTALAFLASFLLAISSWQVMQSRFSSYPPPIDLLFELGCIYFLVIGLKNLKRINFAISGLFLGLAIFMLHYAFALPVAIIPFLFGEYFLNRNRKLNKKYLSCLAVFIFSVLLVVLPRLMQLFNEGGVWWGKYVLLGSAGDLLDKAQIFSANIKMAILSIFWWAPMDHAATVVPYNPLLNYSVAFFCIIGLVYSLYRIREIPYFFICIFFAIMILNASMPKEFEPRRLLCAVPVLFPMAAIGIISSKAVMEKYLHFNKRITSIVLTTYLIFLTGINFNQYFVQLPKQLQRWPEYVTAQTALAKSIARLEVDYQVYFTRPSVQNRWYELAESIVADVKSTKIVNLFDVPLDEDLERDAAIVIETSIDGPQCGGYRNLLRILEYYYPFGKIEKIRDDLNREAGYVYKIKKRYVDERRGLLAKYSNCDSITKPFLARIERDLGSALLRVERLSFPISAMWEGTILIPKDNYYNFFFAAEDDAIYLDGDRIEKTIFLTKGPHKIRIECILNAKPKGNLNLLWSYDENIEQEVPVRLLYSKIPYLTRGVEGEYFFNDNFQGPPLFKRIDPTFYFVDSFPRVPFSARWKGFIKIPVSGKYTFFVNCLGIFKLYLDDQLVVEHNGRDKKITFTSGPVEVQLQEGIYKLKAEYNSPLQETRFLSLQCRLPQSPTGLRWLEVLPLDFLFPDSDSLFSNSEINFREYDEKIKINYATWNLARMNDVIVMIPIENSIEFLRTLAQKESYEFRYYSLIALFNHRSIDFDISDFISSSNWQIRRTVAKVIGDLANPEYLCYVKELLVDSDPIVRHQAAIALYQIANTISKNKVDSEVVDVLVNMLEDKSPYVAKAAAKALLAIESKGSISHFKGLIENGSENAKIALLAALAENKDVKIVPILTSLADDRNPYIKKLAYNIKSGIAKSTLKEQEHLNEDRILELLKSIPNERTSYIVNNKMQMLNMVSYKFMKLLADQASKLHPYAAYYCIELLRPSENIVLEEVFINLLKNEKKIIEISAINMIMKLRLNSTDLVNALRGLLYSKYHEVRGAAVLALGEIGNFSMVDNIARVLSGDKNPWVRSRAAIAMGEIRDKAVLPYLRAALKDSDPWVRVAAAKAIEEVKGGSVTTKIYDETGQRK